MDAWLNMDESVTTTPAPETSSPEPVQAELDMTPAPEARPEGAAPEATTTPAEGPAETPKAAAPSPEPKAKRPSGSTEINDLRAEVEAAKAARADLEEARDEMRAMMDREKDKRRLVFLRSMGAIENVPDSELLKIAPDADVETIAGRAKLDEWRSSVPTMFNAKETPRLTPESLAERAPTNDRASFFTKSKTEEFFRRNLSKG